MFEEFQLWGEGGVNKNPIQGGGGRAELADINRIMGGRGQDELDSIVRGIDEKHYN